MDVPVLHLEDLGLCRSIISKFVMSYRDNKTKENMRNHETKRERGETTGRGQRQIK